MIFKLNVHSALSAAAIFTLVALTPILVNAQKSESQTRTYSYDVNNDGYIQPEELTTYIYSRSDLDSDGYLGDEEWTIVTSQWYRPYKDIDTNQYTYWDQDKDGRLDQNEMKTLVQKTDLHAKWDVNKDGKVDIDEFAKGTFAAYDDNNDGSLNLIEWKKVLR